MRGRALRCFYTVVVLIGAALCAAPAPAEPAHAATPPFDGQWIIDATAAGFFCPVKKKRFVALVQGGRLLKLSGLPGSADGAVTPEGEVSISVKVYGVAASVRGRLTGSDGAGDWSSNSMLCAKGGWRAHAGN